MCPAEPTCPARMQSLPTFVIRRAPTWPQSRVLAPTREPWPTRRGRRFWRRVRCAFPRWSPGRRRSLTVPRHRLQAPRAGLKHLVHVPSPCLAKPKPSPPITTPFCNMTRSPRRQNSRTTACACDKNHRQSSLAINRNETVQHGIAANFDVFFNITIRPTCALRQSLHFSR